MNEIEKKGFYLSYSAQASSTLLQHHLRIDYSIIIYLTVKSLFCVHTRCCSINRMYTGCYGLHLTGLCNGITWTGRDTTRQLHLFAHFAFVLLRTKYG